MHETAWRPARPDENGTGIPPGRTPLEGLADRLARLAWCWPALLALALGLYQMGRPELWRDELASSSFASRPVLQPDRQRPSHRRHPAGLLPAAALLDRGVRGSAYAMRTLSALAMAAAAACVALVGRRLAVAGPAASPAWRSPWC